MSYETTLNKLKGTDIMFSDHKIIQPEFDNRNIPKKNSSNILKLTYASKKKSQNNFKICMEIQKTSNCQSNLEK